MAHYYCEILLFCFVYAYHHKNKLRVSSDNIMSCDDRFVVNRIVCR